MLEDNLDQQNTPSLANVIRSNTMDILLSLEGPMNEYRTLLDGYLADPEKRTAMEFFLKSILSEPDKVQQAMQTIESFCDRSSNTPKMHKFLEILCIFGRKSIVMYE